MIKCVISVETSYHPAYKYGSGFYSNYLRTLQQIVTMEQTYNENGVKSAATPYITWSKSLFVDNNGIFENLPFPDNPRNPWYDWFEEPNYDDCLESVYSDIAYNSAIVNHDGSYWMNDNPYVHYLRDLDKKYNKLKPHIVGSIDSMYRREFQGNTVLGIMARGSEYRYNHVVGRFFDLPDYLRRVDEILVDNPAINKIFLVTDEEAWIEPFKKEFPNTVYCENVARRTTQTDVYIHQNPHWWADTVRPNHASLLGQECLIQAHLLAKCNILFGKLSGFINGAMLFNENITNCMFVE